MSAHTPGAWRVEEGTTLVWGHCNPDDTTSRGMGYPIAEARVMPSGIWAPRPDYDAGVANARLIAAAPDYDAAARDALAFLDRIEGHGYGGEAEYEIAREGLRAAIAKATGEQP